MNKRIYQKVRMGVIKKAIVGFEVLAVVLMKTSTFWDIMPCRPLKLSYACCLFHAGFLLGLLFNPEDVGDMFLQNFG
jgi:hypothetical protein